MKFVFDENFREVAEDRDGGEEVVVNIINYIC